MAFDGVGARRSRAMWAVLRQLLVARVAAGPAPPRAAGPGTLRVTFSCEGEPAIVRDVRLYRPSRDVKQPVRSCSGA